MRCVDENGIVGVGCGNTPMISCLLQNLKRTQRTLKSKLLCVCVCVSMCAVDMYDHIQYACVCVGFCYMALTNIGLD